MWGTSEEKRLEELKMTKEQIDKLSDKTMVGVGIITNVLLEAVNQGLFSNAIIAEVRKKSTFENDSKSYRSTYVSFDREKLKEEIEKKYNIDLVKDEEDDFPYFTDGGFKYHAENENWIFEIEAHVHKMI